MTKQRNIDRLLEIMARLRDPERGCPWDKQQDFATIAPYTVEEAYEVADAIERGDMAALKDELGDLLLQVVFHARMADERGLFDFDQVAGAISDKMVRRHPHVFGSERIDSASAQRQAWEQHKDAERKAQDSAGALDGVPLALPSLARAEKLQRRAARVGFDWTELGPVAAKVREELDELERELGAETGADRVADELGDLLFAVVNLARWLEVDPEASLRKATARFERRFRRIEAMLAAAGKQPAEATLEEMDRLWRDAKIEERSNKRS
ncbi:MAG: nucleoside triphosphate pyrophosphohydrolase [Alphaproteobacteria bacterium]